MDLSYITNRILFGIFYTVYQVVALLGTAVYIPLGLFQTLFKGKSYRKYRHKFGFFETNLKKRLKNGNYLWFHTVSVGESLAAAPLIERFLNEPESPPILISNVTETGNKIISERFGNRVETIYLPLDFKFIISKTLDLIKPRSIVFIETEIWPCLLIEAGKRNISTSLVNGRLSSRSFPQYARFRFFFSEIFSRFSFLSMQSMQDLERVLKLGAAPSKSKNLGNIKFDMPCLTPDYPTIKKNRRKFSIPINAPVICVGSTHQGEEKYISDTFSHLIKKYPNLFLILAPRHPERVPSIYAMLVKAGYNVQLRSKIDKRKKGKTNVLLVDTVGELRTFYSISEITFVGGSLVPIGGHNILEPASMGKPVVFGHHMSNFLTSRNLLLDCGGGIEITKKEGIISACEKLLDNTSLAKKMGQAGQKMVKENQGAVDRNFKLIVELLGLEKENERKDENAIAQNA